MRNIGKRWRGRLCGLGTGVLLVTATLLPGCGEQKPKQEKVDDIVQAQRRARRVKAQADLQAINSSLQAYYAENGRFPDRLEALPIVQDMRLDTSWYVYDPASGQVRMREP